MIHWLNYLDLIHLKLSNVIAQLIIPFFSFLKFEILNIIKVIEYELIGLAWHWLDLSDSHNEFW